MKGPGNVVSVLYKRGLGGGGTDGLGGGGADGLGGVVKRPGEEWGLDEDPKPGKSYVRRSWRSFCLHQTRHLHDPLNQSFLFLFGGLLYANAKECILGPQDFDLTRRERLWIWA